MLTLQDLQTSRFFSASGFGTASSDFLELLNDAVDGMMQRGDWADTLKPICVNVCPVSGTVTWPSFVGQVRKVNMHRRGTVEVRNVWYRFLERQGGYDHWRDWHWDNRNMDLEYKSPTVFDIPGAGNILQFVPSVAQDVGATCTVFGLDNSGNTLQTQNGDGTWSPGITIVAAQPQGSSAVMASTIYRIVLSPSNAVRTLQAYNAATGVTTLLGTYQSWETEPEFIRYKLTGMFPCCTSGCWSVTALIKFAKKPIQNPNDIILINDRNALLNAVRAVKADDSGNGQLAAGYWKAAVEQMNRRQENEFPDETFAGQNNTFGDSRCFGPRMF